MTIHRIVQADVSEKLVTMYDAPNPPSPGSPGDAQYRQSANELYETAIVAAVRKADANASDAARVRFAARIVLAKHDADESVKPWATCGGGCGDYPAQIFQQAFENAYRRYLANDQANTNH